MNLQSSRFSAWLGAKKKLVDIFSVMWREKKKKAREKETQREKEKEREKKEGKKRRRMTILNASAPGHNQAYKGPLWCQLVFSGINQPSPASTSLLQHQPAFSGVNQPLHPKLN